MAAAATPQHQPLGTPSAPGPAQVSRDPPPQAKNETPKSPFFSGEVCPWGSEASPLPHVQSLPQPSQRPRVASTGSVNPWYREPSPLPVALAKAIGHPARAAATEPCQALKETVLGGA